MKEIISDEGEDKEMDEQYEFQVGDRDLNDTTLVIGFQDNDADDSED